ncbi:hypothetical protein KDL67_17355, partial [bacterium]|nr:hypothetical protein [bacterium]
MAMLFGTSSRTVSLVFAGVLSLGLGFASPAPAIDCQDYGGGFRWLTGLAFDASTETDIAFKGDVAYAAMNRIQVIDVSEPVHPTTLLQLTQGLAGPRRVSTDGNLLAASLWQSGMELYDVTDPTDPQYLLRYSAAANVIDVCVVGDRVYAGLSGLGLLTLDVSDPLHPAELDVAGSGTCSEVTALNGYLYTSVFEGGAKRLAVYSLAEPDHPSRIYTWGTDVLSVTPSGDKLYVGLTSSRFAVFDLTAPNAPSHLGTQTAYSSVGAVTGIGDLVFPLYTSYSQIDCYQEAGGAWDRTDAVRTAFRPDAVVLRGDYAYVTSSEALEVFDISTPGGGATRVGSLSYAFSDAADVVAARGGYAYVLRRNGATETRHLDVVDVRAPAAPVTVRTLPYLGTYPADLVLGEQHLYIADGDGIDVVDISDPPLALRVGRLDTPDLALQVDRAGKLLYIADYQQGLLVASIAADPTHPVVVGSEPSLNGALAVAAMGQYALVLLPGGILTVVDAAVPSAPVVLGSLGGLPYPNHVIVDGTTAYCDGLEGIAVLDLSQPALPVLLSQAALPAQARSFAVAGSALYVADDTAGLQVLDVSDPGAPLVIGGIAAAQQAYGVAVDGEAVLVAALTHLDVAPLDCGLITAAPAGAPPAPLRLAAQPNPFNPSTRIHFSL